MKKSLRSKEQIQLQKLLVKMRKEAGLLQEDLAKRLGKPQSFVSKYEIGERRLDIIELKQICKAMGVSFVKLAKRVESLLRSPARRELCSIILARASLLKCLMFSSWQRRQMTVAYS